MTENNQCVFFISQVDDIHVMSCNMLFHYISFLHHKYDNPSYLCLLTHLHQIVSLKLKNFHTKLGELCEPTETKVLFYAMFVYYSFTTSLVESLFFDTL